MVVGYVSSILLVLFERISRIFELIILSSWLILYQIVCTLTCWLASLHAQVFIFESLPYKPLYTIQMLEAVTKPVTSNPMGHVSGGHIRLRGWPKPVLIEHVLVEQRDRMNAFDVKLDRTTVSDATLDVIPPRSVKRASVFCLPILKYEASDSKYVKGLLLNPVNADETPGTYERVGMFGSMARISGQKWKHFDRPTCPSASMHENASSANLPGRAQENDGIAGKGETSGSSSTLAAQLSRESNAEDGKAAGIDKWLRQPVSDESDDEQRGGMDYDEGRVKSVITII